MLERAPRSAWTHFELARLYAREGRRLEAEEHFDAALAHERVAFLREVMSAIRLLDLWPGNPARRAEALEHVKRALELQPRSPVARQLRADLELN